MTMLPGTMFLIDTSALARAQTNTAIRDTILGLIDHGIAATCATIDLETVYSGQTPAEVALISKTRHEHYQNLPLTEGIAERAREVQVLLARRGLHRAAGAIDLLTAAAAERHRATVLHYDADFEHIASVTGQQQQWIVPRGSID